jgi:predicted transcriptional regulator
MQQILLPINPEHIINIFSGEKKYEFRKTRCRESNVQKLFMYATSPVMKVVGEAQIDEIIVDKPSIVWEQTQDHAGINEEFFFRYFQGKCQAVAYKLSQVVKYREPLLLSDFGIHHAPQSLVYIKD